MRRPKLVLAGIALAMGIGLCVAPEDAAAERPGGGSSFGGGGGSSFRSSSGGGGYSSSGSYGGSAGDSGLLMMGGLLFFAMIVSGMGAALSVARKNDTWSSGLQPARPDPLMAAIARSQPSPAPPPFSIEPLRAHDPNVSQILLEDFFYELYARAQEARGREGGLDLLAPYLHADARRALASRGQRRPRDVGGVIVGAMQLTRLELGDGWAAIDVEYETNYTETYPSDDDRSRTGQLGFYAKERWRFVRRLSAPSRKPDETRGLGCPSCGAPVEPAHVDACRHCGTKHGTGDVDWLCSGIVLLREETRGPTLGGYAPEVGTYGRTVRDAALDERLAALAQLDPAFDREQFLARVEMIYHRLNDAWSSLRWEDARPYLSDRLWHSLRYWIHAYEEQGLQNQMQRASVTRKVIVKLAMDPFFHAITVRVWAIATDVTVHRKSGALVGGNPDEPRKYTEYWTFIRSAQRRGAASTDAHCPSCAAPLAINMAGRCEHCGVALTAGQFDWVLSKIEQDEVYRG